ncbi:hypothetical protein GF312_02335 [Candidatus Poribacteria bacterium]|nr:hypothetical protein [Candidatus Poribacteria bacterium]
MTFKLSGGYGLLISLFLFFSVFVFLSGCSESTSSDTSAELNVVLNKTISLQENDEAEVLIPIDISYCQIEILNNSGREVGYKEVQKNNSEKSETVNFSLTDTGTYCVRVSVFDSDDVILGTYNETFLVNNGENTVNIDKVKMAEVYYSPSLNLPQTKSKEALTNFFSHDQQGIHLQSYCFWGKVVEEGKPVNAYLAIAQRLDEGSPDYGNYLFPMVIAGTGYNNEQTARIIFGGSYGIAELTEAVVITQPWHVYVESLNIPPKHYETNNTEMMVLSGPMGEKGTKYKILSRADDLEGGALETEIAVTDLMGFVNQGYGPASFFPQWLLPEQRETITKTYGGSVEDYLMVTNDAMTDQGSYYYSAPMLQVDSFSIKRNGEIISQGSDGLLWMDLVYQSFDTAAEEVVKSATWTFFTIQFPQYNKGIMVTNVYNDSNGSLSVASLFSTSATTSVNGALKPEHRWNIQDTEIEPVPGSEWTSPTSNETYYMKHNIILSGERQANLVVTLAWNEQELSVNNTVKYEGLANVTGTLGGEEVEGTAWVEMQPAGHLQ